MIYAMIKHFQKLFNIRSLESVYPTMTLLNQQVELSRNVQNRLKDLLKLGMHIHVIISLRMLCQQSHVTGDDVVTADSSCTPHKIVTAVELIVLTEKSPFMNKVGKYFGPNMDMEKYVIRQSIGQTHESWKLSYQSYTVCYKPLYKGT